MLPPKTLDELIPHLQEIYAHLSPQFQIAARYLLDYPQEIPTLSARRLARKANVQPATLVRLAQHVGYSGWDELKTVFTQDYFYVRPGSYAERAAALSGEVDGHTAAWRDAYTQHSANLRLLQTANQKAMPEAVRLLAEAQRIIVAGFRSSYAPAFSLYYLINLFRSDVHLLHNIGGVAALDVHRINGDDAVVVISYEPYSREIMVVAEAARLAGSTLVALCDSPLAPMALHADTTLTFSTTGNSFFPSTVASHALIENLARMLLLHCRDHSVKELARTEALLRASKAYL